MPRLSSHWEGYCVVRGPPSDLLIKWYQMVYYAMCAGQTECCLMKISLGGMDSDAHVVRLGNSELVEIIELSPDLRQYVDEWCSLHEISYYIKRPTDPTGFVPKVFGHDYVNSDFAYLTACWSVPHKYKYEQPNPFASSSSE